METTQVNRHVLVYLDEGVGPHAFRQLFSSLREELSPSLFTVKPVDHHYLIHAEWEEQTALLAIPGGRDVYYHKYLKGRGNQRIASYVSNGGRYLGLCAGGYYGSASIEFEKGGELEVCAPRELAFYPGQAVGPAYGLGLFSYESEKGARTALLDWEKGKSHVYFNGGCYFEKPEAHYPSIEVLARYRDIPGTPAAAVNCSVGKGKAILCGFHPEFKMHLSRERQRRAFWRYLLNLTLIKN